jgi:hypothetical protein
MIECVFLGSAAEQPPAWRIFESQIRNAGGTHVHDIARFIRAIVGLEFIRSEPKQSSIGIMRVSGFSPLGIIDGFEAVGIAVCVHSREDRILSRAATLA